MTHLSLFSGIGGLDLAAEWAGFETVGQCEFADFQTKVLEKHWPDVPRWRDVRTLTKERFLKKLGCKQLTASAVDSLANHFPWLESKKAKGTTVTYGLKCYELSENLRRVGSSVRMYLESCELPLPTLSRTWSVKAITSSCLLLRLHLSERRTDENGLRLWPTVTVHGNYQAPKAGTARGTGIATAVRLWPTPIAGQCGMTAKTSGRPIEKSTHLSTQVYLSEMERLWPTPRVGGSKGSSPSGVKHGDLAARVGGQLNPTWVEWLMGFPPGWTDLTASETL